MPPIGTPGMPDYFPGSPGYPGTPATPAYVHVTNLNSDDIVRVYNASGTPLGSMAVTSGTSVIVTLDGIYAYPGTVYVTVQSVGKTESEGTERN